MSDDYKKDKLENLFKSTFDEASNVPAENEWDLPPDRIWYGVDAHLRPEGGLRVGLTWWLLGVGLLVIAGWAIYWAVGKENLRNTEIVSSSSIEEQVQDISDQEQSTYEISTAEPKKKEANHEGGQQVLSDKQVVVIDEATRNENVSLRAGSSDGSNVADMIKEHSSDSEIESGNSTLNDGRSDSKFKSSPTKTNNPSTLSELKEIASVDNSAPERPVKTKNNTRGTTTASGNKLQELPQEKIKQTGPAQDPQAANDPLTADDKAEKGSLAGLDNASDNLNVDQQVLRVKSLETLPLKKAELRYEQETQLLLLDYKNPLANDLITPTAPKSAGFYIGLETSVLESYRTIQAKGDFLVPRFYAEERPDISLGFGMNVGFQLSRNWSIETGLNYTSSALRFRSRRQIRYTRVDEQPNDAGEFQRNYDFAFDTSNGTIDSDVAIARSPGTDVAENDFIGLMIIGKQNFSYLNVPVLARYHFGKGPWQLGLKAGIVNQFLLDATFQFESVNIVRPGVRLVLHEHFFRKRALEKVNAYQADFEVGASLRFFATDQLWIYAEPTYRRSINPSHENMNFKTFPTVKAIEIGLGWRF